MSVLTIVFKALKWNAEQIKIEHTELGKDKLMSQVIVECVFVCSGPVKLPGGGSFSQFDVLGGGWHRSAAGKMDTPPANPTWPPGNIQI